jgi:hypothetical protein
MARSQWTGVAAMRELAAHKDVNMTAEEYIWHSEPLPRNDW